jgi:hypothetical protein
MNDQTRMAAAQELMMLPEDVETGPQPENQTSRGGPGEWPASQGGPRVLVEIPDPELGAALKRTIRGLGYDVAVCGGPATLPGGRCPLVKGRGCPLADHADLIIHGLATDDVSGDQGEAVLAAHGQAHPFTPIFLVNPHGYEGLTPRSLHKALSGPLTHETIVVTISSLLSRTRHSSP